MADYFSFIRLLFLIFSFSTTLLLLLSWVLSGVTDSLVVPTFAVPVTYSYTFLRKIFFFWYGAHIFLLALRLLHFEEESELRNFFFNESEVSSPLVATECFISYFFIWFSKTFDSSSPLLALTMKNHLCEGAVQYRTWLGENVFFFLNPGNEGRESRQHYNTSRLYLLRRKNC